MTNFINKQALGLKKYPFGNQMDLNQSTRFSRMRGGLALLLN